MTSRYVTSVLSPIKYEQLPSSMRVNLFDFILWLKAITCRLLTGVSSTIPGRHVGIRSLRRIVASAVLITTIGCNCFAQEPSFSAFAMKPDFNAYGRVDLVKFCDSSFDMIIAQENAAFQMKTQNAALLAEIEQLQKQTVMFRNITICVSVSSLIMTGLMLSYLRDNYAGYQKWR